MAFTVEDFEDLYRLLSAHPEWRTRLRPLILGDEYVELPSRIAQVDKELGEIRDILASIATTLREMTERQNRVEGRMGNIEGDLLEAKYERNMREWFADYLWPIERVFTGDLSLLRTQLSDRELQSVRAVDLILRGKDQRDWGEDLLMVVEISQTINVDDVERALERAKLLEKAGYRARAAVGGYRLAPGVETRARELDVIVDLRRFAA